MDSADFTIDESLITKVTDYVKDYMSNYDPSHDFNHIRRVVHLAHQLQADAPETSPDVVTLSALLHDVGDRKYVKPGEDPTRLVYAVLLSFGAPDALAAKIQAICLGVSYSSEVKDPARVVRLIAEYPELAIVQDADRLDALGAVGLVRTFTFGGARNRPMERSMEHCEEKLVKLEGMMKTKTGKKLAKERTERVRTMQEWWRLETGGSGEIV